LIAPAELRSESFVRYPPQARSFAVANLPVLQRMPLILIALILRQAIQYDWCFPAEDVGGEARGYSTLDACHGWTERTEDGVADVPSSSTPRNVVYEC
jgi:hypothetical protein